MPWTKITGLKPRERMPDFCWLGAYVKGVWKQRRTHGSPIDARHVLGSIYILQFVPTHFCPFEASPPPPKPISFYQAMKDAAEFLRSYNYASCTVKVQVQMRHIVSQLEEAIDREEAKRDRSKR